MFTTKKIAVVSVINDLVTDNRVNRTCFALKENGYDVVLIGRQLPASLPIPPWPFNSRRMNMLFKTGPLFYTFFMLRLFFRLLFSKANLLYSNDLDTLLPNYIVARLRKIPLIYDSHELFCEVPELQKTPFKKAIWLKIESSIVPRLRHCITVNESIAKIFTAKYKVMFTVVRNITDEPIGFVPRTRPELSLPLDKKIILLQGAGINVDRGAEELIEAMQWVNNCLLLIIGSGDSWPALKQAIINFKLQDRVRMIDKIPKEELRHFTNNADLGLSIDKNTNLNYYNSLPNKIFDYLHAGLPILSSRLPEIEKIVTTFNVGDFIENHKAAHIAEKINGILSSPELDQFRQNALKARSELNWDNEKAKLIKVIKSTEQ